MAHLENTRKLVRIHVSGELVCQVRHLILVEPTAPVMVPLIHSDVHRAEGHQLFTFAFLEQDEGLLNMYHFSHKTHKLAHESQNGKMTIRIMYKY